MQKKLIAVAVAGLFSTAAFAQTTVTLGGLMDLGYQHSSWERAGTKTNTGNFGVRNGSATSNVNFRAIEDLGSGMKATVYIETDPAVGTSTGSAFANAPNWIELSGGFGAVSLGYINNFALTAATTAQPMGTAIGSAYSGAFGRLEGANVLGAPSVANLGQNAAGGSGVRDIRVNNAIQYKSPSFSGFTVGFQYKVKNNDKAAEADQNGQTQIGLGYNNGPLNIAYAHSQVYISDRTITTFVNATFAPVPPIVLGTIGNTKLTHQLLGANYSFGPATIYAGWTSSKHSEDDSIDSTSWNIAGKYAFTPTLAGMLNFVRVTDKNGEQDRNLNGLGLDYSMSKRTTAYIRFENGDNDKSVGDTGDFTRYALGLRHSF